MGPDSAAAVRGVVSVKIRRDGDFSLTSCSVCEVNWGGDRFGGDR